MEDGRHFNIHVVEIPERENIIRIRQYSSFSRIYVYECQDSGSIISHKRIKKTCGHITVKLQMNKGKILRAARGRKIRSKAMTDH